MKPLDEARLLMDITTRQQMYIEGIKLNERNKFDKVLRELSDDLKLIIRKVNYATLDQMTKAELNIMLVKIRQVQSKKYNKYTDAIIEQMQLFMRVSVKQNSKAMTYAKLQFKLDDYDDSLDIPSDMAIAMMVSQERKENNLTPLFGLIPLLSSDDEAYARFWSMIVNNPLPSSGALLMPFIKTFTATSQARIENLVRQAYVNGVTADELIAQIVGIQNGNKGVLNTIRNDADAVNSTVIQFVAAMSSAVVSSNMFGYYVWLSVMDNRTSVICRQRNQQVYQYGVGPMPPAHIRCRSHTMPLQGGKLDDRLDTTFYNWASSQPMAFLVSVFGAEAAKRFKAGTAKDSEKDGFTAVKPLSVEEFENTLKTILNP